MLHKPTYEARYSNRDDAFDLFRSEMGIQQSNQYRCIFTLMFFIRIHLSASLIFGHYRFDCSPH
jgi:hypothetical protein